MPGYGGVPLPGGTGGFWCTPYGRLNGANRDSERKKEILDELRRFKPGYVVVRQRSAHRIYGLRVKQCAEGPHEVSTASESSALQTFLNERCTVTAESQDSIPFQYATIPRGDDDTSFFGLFRIWCRDKSLDVPDISMKHLTAALDSMKSPDGESTAYMSKRKEDMYTVLGIADKGHAAHLMTCTDNPLFCRETFIVELFTVLLHFTFLIMPSLVICYYAISFNGQYGAFLGQPYSAKILELADIFNHRPLERDGGYFLLTQFAIIIYVTLVFMCITFAYLPYVYARRHMKVVAMMMKGRKTKIKVDPNVDEVAGSPPTSPPPSPPEESGQAGSPGDQKQNMGFRGTMTRAFRTAAHHGDYAKVWKVRKHTSWYEQLSTPSVVDLAYSAAFMGHVFYLSALVTFLGTWLMFACLLNPPSLLPFATAILTVLLVSWSIYVSSMKAQNRFRRNFRKALMALIAKRIKHGIHMIKLEENGNAEVVDGIQDDPLCDIDENLTPRDICARPPAKTPQPVPCTRTCTLYLHLYPVWQTTSWTA